MAGGTVADCPLDQPEFPRLPLIAFLTVRRDVPTCADVLDRAYRTDFRILNE